MYNVQIDLDVHHKEEKCRMNAFDMFAYFICELQSTAYKQEVCSPRMLQTQLISMKLIDAFANNTTNAVITEYIYKYYDIIYVLYINVEIIIKFAVYIYIYIYTYIHISMCIYYTQTLLDSLTIKYVYTLYTC